MFAAMEVVARLSNGFLQYLDNRLRRKQFRVYVCVLSAIELAADIAVGVLSIRRFWKCKGPTRASFVTTLVGERCSNVGLGGIWNVCVLEFKTEQRFQAWDTFGRHDLLDIEIDG